MSTIVYYDKLKLELVKDTYSYILLQSLDGIMSGKTPATEEQGCETQTEYYQRFWLLHVFISGMQAMP